MFLSFKQFKKEGFITICPKCQNEYKLDLIISFNCQCDRNKNYFHINELYNELKCESVSRIVGVLLIDRRMTKSVKRKNYINFYLSKSKRLLQKTILNYFPTYYNIFSFKNKKYIEEDTAPFFSEEYINEISIKVNELKNDSIPLKILKEIKAFILDINIFNILLKKGYIYINEINNVINSILKNDIIEIKYDKNHKPININLLDEDKYKDIKNIIKKVKDFSIINNDNIIFTTRNSDKVYIFNKNKENQFYIF